MKGFKRIIWTCEECGTQYETKEEADECCSFKDSKPRLKQKTILAVKHSGDRVIEIVDEGNLFKEENVIEALKKFKNKLNKIENKYMFGKNGKINFREYFYSLYQDIFELNNIDFEECFGILSKEEKK